MSNDIYDDLTHTQKALLKDKIKNHMDKPKRGSSRSNIGRELVVLGLIMVIATLLGLLITETSGTRNQAVFSLFMASLIISIVCLLWGIIMRVQSALTHKPNKKR